MLFLPHFLVQDAFLFDSISCFSFSPCLTSGRYQEEIEYLKRQLEMTGHDNHNYEPHINTNKYDAKRMIPNTNTNTNSNANANSNSNSNGGLQQRFNTNPTASDTNRAPNSLGGLPGVLGALKNDSSNVVTGVVASVVNGRGGGVPGNMSLPGLGVGRGVAPGSRLPGGPLRGLSWAQPGPGVIVVNGSGGPDGGEETYPNNLVIEEQDIVMASVNPGDK
eukprot:TRINITY_DN1480_c0_g1_i1.p1 TRINITY_DN1480_c0_g1~~TRINITY_DN1480_c0_g1_i1.p1  ORF type:complete len:220 (-),score=24.07 TRINITY_DN1480_c0_g1_i1:2-661(-)